MEVFAARFPVFDRNKNVYGYELAFRAGFETYYEAAKGSENVDLTAFVNFEELAGGRKGFIDFSHDLVLAKLPTLFGTREMIVCLSGQMQNDQLILQRCRELKEQGYPLTINDFTVDMLHSPMLEIADLVKVDASTTSLADQQAIVARCMEMGIDTIARCVETEEDFARAGQLGYTYFQGDFFSRPDIRGGKQLGSNKMLCLRLLKEVNQPQFAIDTIVPLIEQDVAMTYKLLRLINSAWFSLRHEVSSIRHALVLLGPKEVRRWASVVAMHQAGEDKPIELLLLSLTRAKFAEQLADMTDMKQQASELFLMGMFSVLDALMDRPLEEVLAEVAIVDKIRQALLGGKGPYGAIYQAMLAYEHAQWVLFTDRAASLRISEAAVPNVYRTSLTWAANALQAEAAVATTA